MAVTVKLAAPALRSATSYYAWPLPTPRGDKDIWGDILNTQTFAGIDAALHNNNPATTGSIDNMVIGGVTPRAATFASMVLNAPLPLASGGTGATTAAQARTNLGVSASGADASYPLKSNNLSDLSNIATARTNLGVTASGADTAYCWRTNNLSDVNATTARTNLGLGTAAVKNTGTSGNTVPLLDGSNTFSGSPTVFNGNVGINSSAPLDIGTEFIVLDIKGTTNGRTGALILRSLDSSHQAHFYGTYGSWYFGTATAQPLLFTIANTERARITADGFFKASNTGAYYNVTATNHEFAVNAANGILFLSNTNATPYGMQIYFPSAAPNNATNYLQSCGDNSTTRFVVYSNGGIANYSANNVNLSDATVKAQITPYDDKDLDALEHSFRAVNWCKFKYRDQSHDDWNHGYIAQDIARAFASSAPELIDETTVGVPTAAAEGTTRKCVYDADLTHIGMALLARALARIDELEHLVHDKKRHKR